MVLNGYGALRAHLRVHHGIKKLRREEIQAYVLEQNTQRHNWNQRPANSTPVDVANIVASVSQSVADSVSSGEFN